MVGDILRRERERQNLSIKDIEKATSIRALYLEAIERSENDKLPGEVYTKGFIKNYANYLKLDSESLVRQYRDEVSPLPMSATSESSGESQSSESSDAQSESTKQSESVKDSKVSEPVVKVSRSTRATPNEGSNRNSLMAIAAVLVLAIVGGLAYYFTSVEGGELASTPEAQPQAVEAIETVKPSEPTSVPSATPPAANVASAAASTDGVNLEAKFSDRCWTRVIVDGVQAYEGTAEPGQSLSWKANDQISITAGNAGAIEFVENGVNLGVAGAVGDVIEKTFVKK